MGIEIEHKYKLTLRRLRYTAQIEEKVLRYSGQPQSTRVITNYGVHLFLWRYFDGNNRVATLVIRKGNEPNEVADCARLNNAWPAIWEISEANVQLSRPKDSARIHAAFLDDEKEACAELAKQFRSPGQPACRRAHPTLP